MRGGWEEDALSAGHRRPKNVVLTCAHVPDMHFDADKEKRLKAEKVPS